MVRQFKSSDKGKTVKTADGTMVGKIDRVSGDRAYVRPDTNLTDSIRRQLDWTDQSKSTYELNHDAVEKIAGDEVHLSSNL